MDLLEVYGKMITQLKISCFDLVKGDEIYLHHTSKSFLLRNGYADRSGLYVFHSVTRCRSIGDCQCMFDGICVYVVIGNDRKGCCGSRIYDRNGNRFTEDFEYYEDFPTFHSTQIRSN